MYTGHASTNSSAIKATNSIAFE
jgi:hypothetical protein